MLRSANDDSSSIDFSNFKLMTDGFASSDALASENNINSVMGADVPVTLYFIGGRNIQIFLDNNYISSEHTMVKYRSSGISGKIIVDDIIKWLVQVDSDGDTFVANKKLAAKKMHVSDHLTIEYPYYKLYEGKAGRLLRDGDLAPATIFVLTDPSCVLWLDFSAAEKAMSYDLWERSILCCFYNLLKTAILQAVNVYCQAGGITDNTKYIIINCNLEESYYIADLVSVFIRYAALDYSHVKELNILVTSESYNAAIQADIEVLRSFLAGKDVHFKIKFVFNATDFWSAIKAHRSFISKPPAGFTCNNFEISPGKCKLFFIGNLSYISPTAITLKLSDLLGNNVSVNDLLQLIDLHNQHIWNVTDIHLALHWLYSLLEERDHNFVGILSTKMITLPGIDKSGVVYIEKYGRYLYSAAIAGAAKNVSKCYVVPGCCNLSINYQAIIVSNLCIILSLGYANYYISNKTFNETILSARTKSFSIAFVVVLFSLFCLYKCIKSLYLSCRFIFAKKIGCSNIEECLESIFERLGNGLGTGLGNGLGNGLGTGLGNGPGNVLEVGLEGSEVLSFEGERKFVPSRGCYTFFPVFKRQNKDGNAGSQPIAQKTILDMV